MRGLRNWPKSITAYPSGFAAGSVLGPNSLRRRSASLAESPCSLDARSAIASETDRVCQTISTPVLYQYEKAPLCGAFLVHFFLSFFGFFASFRCELFPFAIR